MFATEVVGRIGPESLLPDPHHSTLLCGKCQNMDFSESQFVIEDTWSELEGNLDTCDFCRLRWELCNRLDRKQSPPLKFVRDQSMLKLNEGYPPVLSICRSPGKSNADLGASETVISNHLINRIAKAKCKSYPNRIPQTPWSCNRNVFPNPPTMARLL